MGPKTRTGDSLAVIKSKLRITKQRVQPTLSALTKAVLDKDIAIIRQIQQSLDDQMSQLEEQTFAAIDVIESTQEQDELTEELLQISLEVDELKLKILTLNSSKQNPFATDMGTNSVNETGDNYNTETDNNDFVASFDSEEDAIAIQKQLQSTLERGKFKLVKWCSNSIRVCDQIDPTLLCKTVEEMFTNDNLQRVLGMQWHILTDTLAFAPPLSISKTDLSSITQRKLLSMVSQLFDPLGLAAPYTIRIKILLQQTWRSGQHWDRRITDSKFCKEIKDWIDEVAQFKKLEVPRQHPFGVNDSVDLHIFCDASLSATAVVAYFVFKSKEHRIRASFAIGKARVAPLKQQTVPRLELQAAVYSTRLRKTIMNATSYPIARVFHWSDSSSVLSWIKHPHERHKMFVANRLNEILENSHSSEWLYVPSNKNPADNATRGLHAAASFTSNVWLTGPEFLSDETLWPKAPNSISTQTCAVITDIVSANFSERPFINHQVFSQWTRLLNVVVVVLRFVAKLKNQSINYTDAQRIATSKLFRLSQHESFEQEIKVLSKQLPISPKSRLINFSPYLTDQGILRSASRLQNAPIAFATANPILLDAKHNIVRLFLIHQHKIHGHIGVEHLRNILQQQFWILRLRTTLKTIVNHCFTCRRQRQLPSQPRMADLPQYRFSLEPAIFQNVGLDNFGPFTVLIDRKKTESVYCLIFTCLVVRAVHIEVCNTLTSTSTLLAIKRFFTRRGTSAMFLSDNASNFVRSAALISKKAQPTVVEGVALERLPTFVWRFNPPGSPHTGGAWERLIGMAKRIFFNIASSQMLTKELFTTMVCEIESILNSRPLTPVALSVCDVESLTPRHFLQPYVELPLGKSDLNRMFIRKQSLLDQFWKRLLKEFLPTLRQRSKWQKSVDVLKKNDVVWLLEPNTPRGIWPLGVIEEVLPSNDGVPRSFRVRTQKGIFVKPAIKLAPVCP